MIMNLLSLFGTFFYIGLFTIGGGYAMIPLISEIVISKNWATNLELLDYIAVAESTPGPFSVNTATFIGMKLESVLGAVAAVLGLVLPSVIIIILIAKFFMGFLEYKGVKAAFTGLRPAVIGLMASAVISIAMTAFNIDFISYGSKIFSDFSAFIKEINFIEIAIFAVVFLCVKFLKIGTYKIIILSAVLGIVFFSAVDFFVPA